ncbi:sigma-70 family RNA polymerase sigma factor [Candidatus Fermentibacteria bacterium]|nr:sigma-70 family RNA polymerase sigma factor [Candidatus Fermentibacteria bacterium]
MTDRARSRNLDLNSSTLFYKQLDVVPLLTEEEERSLVQSQEESRLRMLSALMSVPPGRKAVLRPLQRLAAGRREPDEILDASYWETSNGVLPRKRREELRSRLEEAAKAGAPSEAMGRARLDWQYVESEGRRVFGRLRECEQLMQELESALEGSGKSGQTIEREALQFETGCNNDGELRRSWILRHRLSDLRKRLALVEAECGVTLEELFEAGRRFEKAFGEYRSILEKLVEANLRLVVKWVRKYYRTNAIEEMDLIQEGCKGLLRAAMRYDCKRGCRFSTYAVWWIRQAILKALVGQCRIIKLPPKAASRNSALRDAIHESVVRDGRQPSVSELAEKLQIDREHVICLQEMGEVPVSLDVPVGRDDVPLADYIASRCVTPEAEAFVDDQRRRIYKALAKISEREKTVISLRFGLVDGEPQTLEAVGKVFGVSRERIRQIEARALAKLRREGILFIADREDTRG